MTDAQLKWEGEQLLLSGEVTVVTVSPLMDLVGGLFANCSAAQVVLNCAGMTNSDSSAIALMVEIHRHAGKSGIALVVEGVREQLAKLITIYGVDWILGVK